MQTFGDTISNKVTKPIEQVNSKALQFATDVEGSQKLQDMLGLTEKDAKEFGWNYSTYRSTSREDFQYSNTIVEANG